MKPRIIFLDIDGVLNCQTFYDTDQCKEATKMMQAIKSKVLQEKYYNEAMLCHERIKWLNDLCHKEGIQVVISSTWKHMGLDKIRKILYDNGATFEIIGCTPDLRHEACVRGNEILQWIKDNEEIVGSSSDYHDYVIIDDDSDMLLWQAHHFFKTDNYSGLTPNICYRIGRFFNGKTFPNMD